MPEMPENVAKLPKDHRGFPVPWFVAWINGVADFRVIEAGKIAEAHNKRLCWICGKPRWKNLAFVIGPMCAINRTISEPPSHRNCAEYAIKACPFLTRPRMRRNEKSLPDHKEAAGVGLKRNPGVSLLWITRSYTPFHAPNGVLFQIGDPIETHWYAEARKATRAEILASIESGLPSLREIAEQEGAEASAALSAYTAEAMKLVPASEAA